MPQQGEPPRRLGWEWAWRVLVILRWIIDVVRWLYDRR